MTTAAHVDWLAAGAECRSAAYDYLARGWAAVPCCPPDHVGVSKHAKTCGSPGKAPLVAWKKYQTELPTADDLARWWKTWPNANVWVALGPVTGLVRVDVDKGQGEEYLAEASGGDLPDTLEMVTGDGRGLFYAIPPGFVPRITHQHGDKVHEGLSLLGQGAGTVMPPSRHRSGRVYRWADGRGPDDIHPAAMPGWLMDLMRQRQPAAGKSAGAGLTGEKITEPGRNTKLTSIGGAIRRQGGSYESILAALLSVNKNQCDPPLPDEEVEKIARSVSRYKPQPDPAVRIVSTAGQTPSPNGDGKPHGGGPAEDAPSPPPAEPQTVLREALLAADHNAYHLGQLVVVRRLLGCWPEES